MYFSINNNHPTMVISVNVVLLNLVKNCTYFHIDTCNVGTDHNISYDHDLNTKRYYDIMKRHISSNFFCIIHVPWWYIFQNWCGSAFTSILIVKHKGYLTNIRENKQQNWKRHISNYFTTSRYKHLNIICFSFSPDKKWIHIFI